jgi:hypothetical protein
VVDEEDDENLKVACFRYSDVYTTKKFYCQTISSANRRRRFARDLAMSDAVATKVPVFWNNFYASESTEIP